MGVATQQILLGSSLSAPERTYVDDIFSTLIFEGNNTYPRTVTNGINFSEEGGLIIGKARTNAYGWVVWDTVRGAGDKSLRIDNTGGENNASVGPYVKLEQFNSDGFRLGQPTSQDVFNANGENGVFWSFRKTKGFLDVVKFTGTGGTNAYPQTINHSLESIPGMIIIKNLTQASQWFVYHKSTGVDKFLQLNKTDAAIGYNGGFKNITSSSIDVFDSNSTNTNEFIAYVFAGGESIDDTARSVDFDGTSDYLSTASSSDLTLGTGDFTVECWMKWDSEPAWNQLQGAYQISTNSNGVDGTYAQTPGVGYYDTKWKIYGGGGSGFVESAANEITPGVWYHVAHVRASSVSKLYLNGVEIVSMNDSYNYTGTYMAIGAVTASSGSTDGSISNMRVVKGTALYTSSFRPPTKPLTNISGTSILCCNNSSTTGKTVGPTLTANGTLAANTSSPFDDPDSFKFGEARESVIKLGNYEGAGTAGNEVFLGFEPQWVLIKCTSHTGGWRLFDSMRGINSGGNDAMLQPNSGNAEVSTQDWIDVTPTGFILQNTDGNTNGGGFGYIYITIRRPDGYVGKPAEAGTDVFTMATAASAVPRYSSGFPVDFAFKRRPGVAETWYTGARIIGKNRGYTDATTAFSDNNSFIWDNNTHWPGGAGDDPNVYQAWMWKRHAGFDVVAYAGNGVARQIPHSLSKVPEMIWVKRRDSARTWGVYHKGLNGGTNPEQYAIYLDTTQAENSSSQWNNTAHTAINFSLGTSTTTNNSSGTYIAMLFASVDGISKVGSYTGTGNNQSVTTGFQPRFILIKRTSYAEDWFIFDSLRGLVSGSPDPYLRPNETAAQVTTASFFDISSTGFTVTANFTNNANNYIYYAHA